MKSFSELDWSSRRRLIYMLSILFLVIIFILYKLYPMLNPPASCADKKQNGTELGIDCGGVCNLQCKNTYQPLDIVLQKAFPNGDSYDLLVLFENDNKYVAPYIINLDLDIYDSTGILKETVNVNQIAGTQKYIPVIINDYKSGSVSKVFARNIRYDMYSSRGAIDLALSDYEMSDDNTKLRVKIRNIYKQDLNESTRLYVLLRDINDNIVGINYQNIDSLAFEEERDLNFLWSLPVPGEVKNIDLITVSNLYR